MKKVGIKGNGNANSQLCLQYYGNLFRLGFAWEVAWEVFQINRISCIHEKQQNISISDTLHFDVDQDPDTDPQLHFQ